MEQSLLLLLKNVGCNQNQLNVYQKTEFWLLVDPIIQQQNGSVPAPDYVLESTHIHAYTRPLLHTNGISIDQEQNVLLIQSSKYAD